MTLAVYGGGLVGRRAAAQLESSYPGQVWLVGLTRPPAPLAGVEIAHRQLPPHVRPIAAVVASAPDRHVALCRGLVEDGIPVVSAAGEPMVADSLMALGTSVSTVPIVVGAAYSPGLSSLLAAQLMAGLDEVFEVAVASFGTGGPACARAHHRALSAPSMEVRDGQLHRPRSGSGRQLVWFPEPVGGADCYLGGLADPSLIHHAFPSIDRVQARLAATRRDRLTSRLPMLRRPHAEGLVGALVVEVRGRRAGQIEHRAMAASAPQATGAAQVAAAIALRVAAGQVAPGAQPVVGLPDPGSLLARLSNEVRLWTYDGSATTIGDASTMRAARAWRTRG